MILHHPCDSDPKELLKDHIDWKAAYQTECVEKGHVHKDPLPTSCDDDGNEGVDDSESVPDVDLENENWRQGVLTRRI
jgi:hypothetical protein